MQMKRDFFCMVTIAFIIKLKAAVRKGTTAFKT